MGSKEENNMDNREGGGVSRTAAEFSSMYMKINFVGFWEFLLMRENQTN